MNNRFIQLHTLTSYPATLLNRDDAGFAKRIPFGGSVRTRISSQCLKRHWRTYDGEYGLGELEVPASIRSRITFQKHIVDPLVTDGKPEDVVRSVTEEFMKQLLGESPKAKKSKSDKDSDADVSQSIQTGQITVFGKPEIDFIRQEVAKVVEETPDAKKAKTTVKEHLGKEGKKNLKALKHGAGLSAALFGRMVTSDILARTDAAIHVAHAMTVHSEETESDYFSAVDDLLQETEGALGSGHINSTELTSGLFYGYVVIDTALLISNIEGCDRKQVPSAERELSARVITNLVNLITRVSPGAKLGSTAPYASAHLVLAETGSTAPRTLCNAFLKAVEPYPDLLENTYRSLATYLDEYHSMYGKKNDFALSAMGPKAMLTGSLDGITATSVDEVASFAAEAVRSL